MIWRNRLTGDMEETDLLVIWNRLTGDMDRLTGDMEETDLLVIWRKDLLVTYW